MIRFATFILVMLFQAACGLAVTVGFEVTVPATTPPDSKIFLSGNTKSLGEWNGAGLELKRNEAGVYVANLSVSPDQSVEFKVTRGSWQTVEKQTDGSERENRKLAPKSDQTIKIKVQAWADQLKNPATTRASTRTGDIRLHPIQSNILNNQRNLWVYLPPEYEKHPDQRYPVFYMHDGQNLFDAATSFAGEWQADETAGRLINEKKIRPIIIVGIENNAQRLAEYTPERGELYQRFVIQEAKPFIDANYRTLPDRANTAVGGSSLGGLISLYLVKDHPDVFGSCAAISPALWWNDRAIFTQLKSDANWMKRTRFWIDMGTDEAMHEPAKNVQDVNDLAALLSSNGLVENKDFRLLIVEGGKHNEPAWAKRFDQVLEFFFKAE